MATTTPMSRTSTRPAIALTGGDRVAIIAGSGRLPLNVAAGLKAAGHDPFIIIAGGEPAELEALRAYSHTTLQLEEMGGLNALLGEQRITHVVLAGGISRRPRLRNLKPSLGLLKILPRLAAGFAKGDNGLLRTIVRIIEAPGRKVVGAHEVVPDLVADEGVFTLAGPTGADRKDLAAAFAAAKAIGALDIGQAAVAIGGRVIALEGVEGTDGLLARCTTLRSHGRLSGKKRGVIVKCAKPGQELRADMPAIGPQTVTAAHAAGLVGIGVEAGRALILDFDKVLSLANEHGLFVIGMPGDGA
jgi:DUF1009 family protein